MKLIYLAGPYRGDTFNNIAAARVMAIDLIKLNLDCFPVTPHLNTAFFELSLPDVDDEFWLAATLELMKKCDAILLINPHGYTSKGTLKEVTIASKLHIPTYVTLGELENAITKGKSGNLDNVPALTFEWINAINGASL